MTTVTLTSEQLHSLGGSSSIVQGPLSAFSNASSQSEAGRVTNPQLAKSDGSIQPEILPAFQSLANPASITKTAFLRADSLIDAVLYVPIEIETLPIVALIGKKDELELKFPDPAAEIVSGLTFGMLPTTEDHINLDLELPLTQAWVIWAMLDWVRFNKEEERSPLPLEELTEFMEFPMLSLYSLAAYFREALDLAQPSQSEVEKACSALVDAKLVLKGDGGYLPAEEIVQLGVEFVRIRSHLRLVNKVLKKQNVYEMKYWCVHGENGLCLLWYEVNGVVQFMSLSVDKLIHLVEQLIFNSDEDFS